MIASLVISPVPVSSSETLSPEQSSIMEQPGMAGQFDAIEQLAATPVLDCHNGQDTHFGSRGHSGPVESEQLADQDGQNPDAEEDAEGDSHACPTRCYCHQAHSGRNYSHQHCYIPDYC